MNNSTFDPRPSTFGARSCSEGRRSKVEGRMLRQHAFQFLDLVAFDDVPDFDVLELLDADAALEALANLGNIVLEVPERGDLALVNDTVVAQQADIGRSRDDAIDDHATGDRARLRHLERVPDLGASLEDLLELRIEQAGHGRLDL